MVLAEIGPNVSLKALVTSSGEAKIEVNKYLFSMIFIF